MMYRRCHNSLLFLLLVSVFGFALAQEAPKPTVAHNVDFGSITMDTPFTVHQQVVELAPGAESPIHMHGGPELVLVTAGEVTLVIDEAGAEMVYQAGETYTVPADTFLMVRNDTSELASFVVTFLLPEGATLTTPKPLAEEGGEGETGGGGTGGETGGGETGGSETGGG